MNRSERRGVAVYAEGDCRLNTASTADSQRPPR